MVNELRSEPAGAQNMKLVASRGSRSYQQALPPLRQRYAGKLETKRNSASNSTETGLLDLTAPPASGTIREIPFIATNWLPTDLILGLLLLLRLNKFEECFASSASELIRIEFPKKSERIQQNPSECRESHYSWRNAPPSHFNKPSVGNTNLSGWKLIFSRNLKPKSQGVSYRAGSSWETGQPPEERIGKTSLCLCKDYLLIRFGPLNFDQLKRF